MRFEAIFQDNDVKSVSDCACGTGHHVYMMAKMGMEVSGSDYSESMLEMAKQNLSGFREIRFYGDYHRNPYADESRRLIVVAK